MLNQKPTLTASNIRYLLALNELNRDGAGAKSSEIAKYLGVTKPSVHTMIKKFCEKGYVTKKKYESIHLTAWGKQLAQQYAERYERLYDRMERSLGLTPEDCRRAVCAILAQTCPGEPAAEGK